MFFRTLPILILFSFFLSVTGQIRAQATDIEPKPYILYWGQLEAKMQWNDGQKRYEAKSDASPSDFRLSIQREPRLWTGESLLKNLDFKIEELPVTCRENDPNSYTRSRAGLDRLAVQADNGSIYTLQLTMPDGQLGIFSIHFKVEAVATEDKEFWQKSGLMKESVWGKPLAQLTESREFVSYAEFNTALSNWFAHMTLLPLTSDKEAIISLVPPLEKPTEIKLPRNIHEAEAQKRIYQKLNPQMVGPGTQVFFQVRPKGAWVGDFLHFYIVREDDPLLHRNKYDRRMFGFEWGNFRFELKGYYGNSILLKDGTPIPVDAELKQEEKSLDAAQIKQLLDLELRVWENKALLPDLEYILTTGQTSYNFKAGSAIPELIRTQFDAAIDRGDNLTITGFKAKEMDLRNLSLIFIPKNE